MYGRHAVKVCVQDLYVEEVTNSVNNSLPSRTDFSKNALHNSLLQSTNEEFP